MSSTRLARRGLPTAMAIAIASCCCLIQVKAAKMAVCPNRRAEASQLMMEVKTECFSENISSYHRGACMDDCMISKIQAAAILQTCRAKVLRDGGTRRAGRAERRARKKRSIINFDKLPKFMWGRPIIYKIQSNFSDIQRVAIRKALQHWEEKTCLTFHEVPSSEQLGTKPHVIFKKGDGCISFVGKVEKQPQPIFLDGTCFKYLTVTHEVGHLLGLWHTHQQPGRNKFVKVWEERITPGEEGSFTILPESLIRTTDETGYDFASVMHYDRTDLADGSLGSPTVIETLDSLRQQTIGQRVELSFLDAKTINKAYCSAKCHGRPLTSPCHNGGYQNPRDCSVCICPDGWAGTRCDDLSPSEGDTCGGELSATVKKQVISSPRYNFNKAYPRGQHCTWRIKSATGGPVKLKFTGDFGLHCTPLANTCHDWVELRFRVEDSILGPRFCCESVLSKTFTGQTNEMLVLLRAQSPDSTAQQRRGFSLQYYTDPDAVRCSSTPCRNGGSCMETGIVLCRCQSGFTGDFCEKPSVMSRCASNPCQGGGTCQEKGRICVCPENRMGDFCQNETLSLCQPNPCQNGGICTDSSLGVFGQYYFCMCKPGYRGQHCEGVVTRCSSNPCQGGGTCQEMGKMCQCPANRTGIFCENGGTNACRPNPCLNGGVCVAASLPIWGRIVNSYICMCTSGFMGRKCETALDSCFTLSCTFGRCVDQNGIKVCRCDAGYSGRSCSIDVNECSSSPCQNGGRCLNLPNSFECICSIGYNGPTYTGLRCETEIHDACTSSPCQHGQCMSIGSGAYYCTCTDGWTGENCDMDMNKCSSSPCQNGGQCLNRPNSFKCICSIGYSGATYTGPRCETEIHDACTSSPCQHGQCMSIGSGAYYCTCTDGWTGENCDMGTEIHDGCATSPCQHGQCFSIGSGGYYCICADGWTGDNCAMGDEIPDGCATRPCQHGQCISIGSGGYYCTCTDGWTGENCDMGGDVSRNGSCAGDMCKNGGSCLMDAGGASTRCHCRQGTYGEYCEHGHCGGCDAGPGSITTPCMVGSSLRATCTRSITTQHTSSAFYFFRRSVQRTRTIYYACRQQNIQSESVFCCDNARLVSDSNSMQKKCIVTGWEPYSPCSADCGACGVSTRSFVGLTEEGTLSVGMTQSRPCNTFVCGSCSWFERMTCQCVDQCCDGFQPVGGQCVANGQSRGHQRRHRWW